VIVWGVKEGEKVLFVVRGNEIILKVVKGSILDLRGSVRPTTRPEDFDKVRHSVKQTVARRVARHG